MKNLLNHFLLFCLSSVTLFGNNAFAFQITNKIHNKISTKLEKLSSSKIKKGLTVASFLAGSGCSFYLMNQFAEKNISFNEKKGLPKTKDDKKMLLHLGTAASLISIGLGNVKTNNQFFNSYIVGSLMTTALFSNTFYILANKKEQQDQSLAISVGFAHAASLTLLSSKHRLATAIATSSIPILLSGLTAYQKK